MSLPSDLEERVKACFRVVFPQLSEHEIRSASPASVGAWDSMATVMLVSAIDEEFGIELDLDRLNELDSFSNICACVRDVCASAVLTEKATFANKSTLSRRGEVDH
jgi:acyl carrier protein